MGTVKAIFGILVIVALIYVGIQVVPAYFENYEFQDFLQNEALTSTYTTKTEDAIRDSVMKKAADLDIPLTKEGLKVTRVGSMGSGSVSITTNYTVRVSLPGYSFDLHFNPSSSNKSTF